MNGFDVFREPHIHTRHSLVSVPSEMQSGRDERYEQRRTRRGRQKCILHFRLTTRPTCLEGRPFETVRVFETVRGRSSLSSLPRLSLSLAEASVERNDERFAPKYMHLFYMAVACRAQIASPISTKLSLTCHTRLAIRSRPGGHWWPFFQRIAVLPSISALFAQNAPLVTLIRTRSARTGCEANVLVRMRT